MIGLQTDRPIGNKILCFLLRSPENTTRTILAKQRLWLLVLGAGYKYSYLLTYLLTYKKITDFLQYVIDASKKQTILP